MLCLSFHIEKVSTSFLLNINVCTPPISGWQRTLRSLVGMTATRMQRNEMMLIIILLFALTIICHGFRLHRRCKFALLTQLLAEQVEAYRNRDHDSSETAQKCARPLNTEVIEHLAREEWEAGSDDGSQECVGCDCGCSAGLVSDAGDTEKSSLTT